MSAYVYEFGARIVMLRDNDGYKFHQLFTRTALPDRPPRPGSSTSAAASARAPARWPARTRPHRSSGSTWPRPDCAWRTPRPRRPASPSTTGRPTPGTGLEDASCDVVTGTMVLHEMPAEAIRETIEEAARLLKPGGALRFLEFRLTGDPLRDATVYEHAERNNEPFFHALFGSDLSQLRRGRPHRRQLAPVRRTQPRHAARGLGRPVRVALPLGRAVRDEAGGVMADEFDYFGARARQAVRPGAAAVHRAARRAQRLRALEALLVRQDVLPCGELDGFTAHEKEARVLDDPYRATWPG